jgi:hypothetical protein
MTLLMQIPNRNSLEAIHGEHRLLAILRGLMRLPGFTGNLPLMRDYLEAIGLVATMDTVRGDLRRLKEMGLAEVSEGGENGWRVVLTERGNDVAEGRLRIEGICRVEPGCGY